MMNVSSKMPMVNPNKNSSCIGCVMSTANVAARIMPADEMTPPVSAMPRPTASFHGWVFASSRMRDMSMML